MRGLALVVALLAALVSVSRGVSLQHSVADAVLGSARQLAGNYALLNNVLGGLTLTIDTSTVGTIVEDGPVGIKVTFTMADEATCTGLGLGNVALTSGFEANTVVEGTEFQRYDIGILAENLLFRCEIGVVTELGLIGDNPEDGIIVAISEASATSFVSLKQTVLSEDFSIGPPTQAFDVEGRNCSTEVVDVARIRFEAGGDGVLATYLGGLFDLTDIILDEFNGDKKSSATEPISTALCSSLQNFTATINELAVSNPFTNATTFGIAQNATLGDAAVQAERDLVPPADVELVNLGNNSLLNLILPVEDGALVLDASSPLISGLFEFLNITFGTGVSPGYALVDFFFETDIAVTNGSFADLDVLEVAERFLTDAEDPEAEPVDLVELLTFNFSAAEFGNATFVVESLLLSSAPSGGALESFDFVLLGNQTLAFPPIDLGDLSFVVGVAVDVQLSTTLLNQTFEYDIAESLTVALGWKGFLAQLATLLAVDGNQVQTLEVGPLFKNVLDCVVSTFWVTPQISAALFNADSVDLVVSDVDDGLLNLLADLANALSPVYQGVVPGAAEFAAESSILNTQLLEPANCSATPLDNVTSLPYDFSEGIFAFISDTLSEELVTTLLEGIAGDSNSSLGLVSSSLELFSLDIPTADGSETVSLAITSLTVDGLLPPDLERLSIFDVSELSLYYPQGLLSELDLGSAANPIVVELGVLFEIAPTASGSGSGSGRRRLAEVNELTIKVSFDNVDALLDIFATLSVFDVEATRLNEVTALSCWTAKLDPGGGVKKLDVLLANTSVALTCAACDNAFLNELAARLEEPAELAKVVGLLETFTSAASEIVVDAFATEKFQDTVEAAALTCAGLTAESAEFEALDEADLSLTLGLIGAFFSCLSVAGVATCCCSFARRPERPLPAGKVDPEDREDDRAARDVPLWRNPAVPRVTRVLVPLFLLNNFVLFIIGHVDVVIKVDLLASVLGTPLLLEDFASLSVISSVVQLFEGEAYLLAFLILGFSVVWPYLKIFGMAYCWFSPPRALSFKRRGKIAKLLDQLGKWSLVELFFVSFVLVVLQVEIAAPTEGDLSFLAGAFDIELVIKPQFSLYMFTLALMLSLGISNVVVSAHETLEHAAFLRAREESGKSGTDSARYSLANYRFEKKTTTGKPYHLALSARGAAVMALSSMLAIGLSLFGASVPVLTIFYNGIARLLLVSAGSPTEIVYSLFTYVADSFATTDPGFLFFSTVLVITTIIVPVAQLLMLVVLVSKPFTLPRAIQFRETNNVLSAWSALEVFVLSIVVVVLELKAITGFLVEETCAPLRGTLETLQSIDALGIADSDLDASCFGLSADVEAGAFVLLGALAVAYATHILIDKWFEAYIDNRKSCGPTVEDEDNVFLDTEKLDVDVAGEGNVPRATAIFARLGLVTVSSSHFTGLAVEAGAAGPRATSFNPLYPIQP